MKRVCFFVLFMMFHLLVLADMGPKFSESIVIRFYENGKRIESVDSIHVVVNGNDSAKAILHYNTIAYHIGATLTDMGIAGYALNSGSIQTIRVFIRYKGKDYISETLKSYPGSSIYKFEVTPAGLRDNSQLFHSEWWIYIIALIVTLVLEGSVLLLRKSWQKSVYSKPVFVAGFIGINLLTHFSLWYVYSHFDISIFLLELIIILVEAVYWSIITGGKYGYAMLLSLFTNFVSWILGSIILFAQ